MTEKKLELKVGGSYLRGDGEVVFIVRKTDSVLYPFQDETKTSYRADGKYQVSDYHASTYDLIEEHSPTENTQ